MKIIFMGSPAFVIPTLETMVKNHLAPSLLVCQPDRPAGRGHKLTPPAAKVYALEMKIPVFQPEKLDDAALKKLQDIKADLAVVLAYGRILKRPFLECTKFGCINLHASLLPHLRGAAPIEWALLNGDKLTGITIQKCDEGMDTGPILLQKELHLTEKTNRTELTEKLSQLAAQTCLEFFKKWNGQTPLEGQEQDHEKATYAPKVDAALRKIDWNSNAPSIERKVRAFAVEPGARTYDLEGEVYQILKAQMVAGKKLAPGQVSVEQNHVFVGTGDATSCIELLEIKAGGSRPMATPEFLKGHQMPLAFH